METSSAHSILNFLPGGGISAYCGRKTDSNSLWKFGDGRALPSLTYEVHFSVVHNRLLIALFETVGIPAGSLDKGDSE